MIRYGIYNTEAGTITEFFADEGDTITIRAKNGFAKPKTIKIEELIALLEKNSALKKAGDILAKHLRTVHGLQVGDAHLNYADELATWKKAKESMK